MNADGIDSAAVREHFRLYTAVNGLPSTAYSVPQRPPGAPLAVIPAAPPPPASTPAAAVGVIHRGGGT